MRQAMFDGTPWRRESMSAVQASWPWIIGAGLVLAILNAASLATFRRMRAAGVPVYTGQLAMTLSDLVCLLIASLWYLPAMPWLGLTHRNLFCLYPNLNMLLRSSEL